MRHYSPPLFTGMMFLLVTTLAGIAEARGGRGFQRGERTLLENGSDVMIALLRRGFLSLVILACSCPGLADELEPRRWAHLPINTNFLGAGYAYTEADIGLDPVLKLEDVQVGMDTWAAKCIRTFSLLDKSARIDLIQAYQEGRWNGLLDGVPKRVTRSGWSDTVVRFALNLYGAPPLEGEAYAKYRAAAAVETIVGAGLSVQLPTGDYLDDKLINLGTNRFTFRPQFGVIHTRGKWSAEATSYVTLYTDNTDFFNGKRLETDPLYVVNCHLIYTFRPAVWVGASAGYDFGGRSTVDGVERDDRRQNLVWALNIGFPVNRYLGIKMGYLATRTRETTGSDSDTFTMGVSTFW